MSDGKEEKKHDHYLRRELYELVRDDASLFDFLQNGCLDGIWYWDLEHPENEWMSPEFWRTFGHDPAEKSHLASEWQDMIHAEDLQMALTNFERHCADPQHRYDQEVRYRHSDGSTVWVRCRGMAVRNADGVPIRMLGAHQNITELKRANDKAHAYANQLAANAHELEEANRRLSEFARVISHDLRAPLRGLDICLGWLQRDLATDPRAEVHENLRLARSRGARLRAFIDGVLENTRVGAAAQHLEELDVVTIVQGVFDALAVPPRVHLDCGVLPRVRYDRTELTQVFQNLVSNGLDFVDSASGRIHVSAETIDGMYRFSVTDNGPGIEAAYHGKIFDLFETLERRDERESSGVGLTICRTIVEKNGGTIGVESEPGHGCKFWFTVANPDAESS